MSVPDGTHRRGGGKRVTGNHLLDELPPKVRAAVLAHARPVDLGQDQVLFSPGMQIAEVHFPVTAVCASLLGLASGQRADTGTIGNEGFVGIQVVLGTAPNEFAIVQIAGKAYAVAAEPFVHLVDTQEALRNVVRGYCGYAYHFARQSSLCNAYHNIDQRIARWLLTAQDRALTNRFTLTQSLLGEMVAASRPRVAEALARLRADGVIDYGRADLLILDRAGLEARACECYHMTEHPLSA